MHNINNNIEGLMSHDEVLEYINKLLTEREEEHDEEQTRE